MNIKLIQILKQDLDALYVVPGQVIQCTDTEQTYYDNQNSYRMDITYSTIYVKTEKDKLEIPNPLLNRMVIVLADKSINYFNGVEWQVIYNLEQLEAIVNALDEYIPTILAQGGKLLAPRTVADAVYTKDGFTVLSEIEDNKRLIETKVKCTYEQVREDGQKLFVIPFPIDNFDFNRNYMQIFANGNLCDPGYYTVIDDHVILNNTVELNAGNMVLFVFYYQTMLDQNVGVVLGTDNLEDKCITTPKLSDSIRLNADNVVENVERIFFTPTEKKKLDGIEENATHFVMPETLPATMIVQDPDHRFVSDKQIANWNGKANASDVYTKTETDQRIQDVVDAAPAALDTLKELAEALGNDPNFAATVTTELAKKASKKSVDELTEVVNGKTNLNDYVRNCMYITVSSTTQTQLKKTVLSGDVVDSTFQQYIDGMQVVIKMDKTNVFGNCELNINSLPNIPIINQMGYPVGPGDLVAKSIYTLRFNGTTSNFILQGKGGVNLRNTQLENFIASETISSGNLIDILPSKEVAITVPESRTITTHETSLPDYLCDNSVKIVEIPGIADQFLMIWTNGQVLKAQMICITNDFIDISRSRLKAPIVINSQCVSFEIKNVNGVIVLAYYSAQNEVTIEQVYLDGNGNISFGTPYFIDESQLVDKFHLIPINGQCMCVYEHGKVTKGIYFQCKQDRSINILRIRDNLGYSLDTYGVVSNNQIIFASSIGDTINAWVMVVSTSDFELSAQVSIVENNADTFNDPVLTTIGTKQLISIWTNTAGTKVYRQFIQLDYKGGIVFAEPIVYINDPYKVSSNNLPVQTFVSDDFYVAASAHNCEIPSIDDSGKKALKITMSKINITENGYGIINTTTCMSGREPISIDYKMVGFNRMVVAYTARNPITSDGTIDPLHIYFAIVEVRKYPHGVALTNAVNKELIKTSVW